MQKRRILTIITLLFIGAGVVSFVVPKDKIKTVISKVWEGKDVKLEAYKLPDTLQYQFEYFGRITEGDKLLGYACYTTAYGCRIGGCEAPKEDSKAQYETFDYIVIYDPNILILKVEIADYPGEHGSDISDPKWLKQFEGQTDGFEMYDNVDGITGATTSVKQLVKDINQLGCWLIKLKQNGLI